ncbi:3-Hydroxybutyryl-CoA dehydrogenase [Aspergillus sclerotialis]|uniref:3-Hydroxybutyryl-CoA dehydrogenase n=1 Tax=Aspergillus sclerotialis TaxID=2070753 RepID=A0A3A3A6S2_9EURO|nr:3-Hydroxybutyryl-CoA dehydrogenase [Aspergillus sclerotialis]
MSEQLSVRLNTTLALIDQFQSAFTAPSKDQSATESPRKDALPLLSASSEALKSQVTKLSLLTINTPFTPSAIGTVLSALNESVLPSLLTATLLVTPNDYTNAFHSEVQSLSKTALNQLSSLVKEVKNVAEAKDKTKNDGQKESELSQPEKDAVTVATGRVWDSCDFLTDLAAKGVVGFVTRRVEEWRDLVGDAVKEIEEWDPNEDDGGFFEEFLGDNGPEGAGDESEDSDEGKDEDNAALHAHKKSTLRILKPVGQAYPAIITNRLKNAGNVPSSSDAGVRKLESLMSNLQCIPEYVDEVAGALYDADLVKSDEYLQKAKSCATKAIELVTLPWSAAENESNQQDTQDKFTVWSRTWLKVMEEVSKPANGTPNTA